MTIKKKLCLYSLIPYFNILFVYYIYQKKWGVYDKQLIRKIILIVLVFIPYGIMCYKFQSIMIDFLAEHLYYSIIVYVFGVFASLMMTIAYFSHNNT